MNDNDDDINNDELFDDLSQRLSLTQVTDSSDDYGLDLHPASVRQGVVDGRMKISGIHITYDIDSVLIAAKSLRPFRISESILLHVGNVDVARFNVQKKLLDCVSAAMVDQRYAKRQYYSLNIAGYDKETIEIIFQYKIERVSVETGISTDLAKSTKSELLNDVILPAVRSLRKDCPTSYRGCAFAAHYPENIQSGNITRVVVYAQDWHVFANAVDRRIRETARNASYTNVVFIRSRHGRKATPEECRRNNDFYCDMHHEDIIMSQYHVANTFWPNANEAIMVKLDNVTRVLGGGRAGLKRYRVSFLYDYGYFHKYTANNAATLSRETNVEATRRMTDDPRSFVTSVTAYNPAIHPTLHARGSTGIPFALAGNFRLPSKLSSALPTSPNITHSEVTVTAGNTEDVDEQDPDYDPRDAESNSDSNDDDDDDDDGDGNTPKIIHSIYAKHLHFVNAYTDWYERFQTNGCPLRIEDTVTIISGQYDSPLIHDILGPENNDDVPNRPYRVTNHDGSVVRLNYTTRQLLNEGLIYRLRNYHGYLTDCIEHDLDVLQTSLIPGSANVQGDCTRFEYLERLYDAETRIKYFANGLTLSVDYERMKRLWYEVTEKKSVLPEQYKMDIHKSAIRINQPYANVFRPLVHVDNPHMKNVINMLLGIPEQHLPTRRRNASIDAQLADYVIRMHGMYALRYFGFRETFPGNKYIIDPSTFFQRNYLDPLFHRIPSETRQPRKGYVSPNIVTTVANIVEVITAPTTIYGKMVLYGITTQSYETFQRELTQRVRNFNYFPSRFFNDRHDRYCWFRIRDDVTPITSTNRMTHQVQRSPIPSTSGTTNEDRRAPKRPRVSTQQHIDAIDEDPPRKRQRRTVMDDSTSNTVTEELTRDDNAEHFIDTDEQEAATIRDDDQTEILSTCPSSSTRPGYPFTDEQRRLIIRFAVANEDGVGNWRTWNQLALTDEFADATRYQVHEECKRLLRLNANKVLELMDKDEKTKRSIENLLRRFRR